MLIFYHIEVKKEIRHFVFLRSEFNKFNNTGARMLEVIYHMILKLPKDRIFGV